MSHMSCLMHVKIVARNINRNIFTSKQLYCTKKPINANKTIRKKSERKNAIKVNETFDNNDNIMDVEKLVFDQEEDICPLTEREKDAAVRSRLSKNCNTLSNKKITLSPSGLNLYLDTSLKNPCCEDSKVEKTPKGLKRETPAPTVATTDSSSSTPPTNRIKRMEPGKVLFAFIPKEWPDFFLPTTGVTGFYTFLFTFGTFLVSKEYYILEHNYYGGLSMMIILWAAIKYIGPHLKNYLDREIDNYENAWKKGRAVMQENLEQQIEDERLVQYQADGQLLLIEAKRENIALQLEDEFRKRQMHVYSEVKKRLDYHVNVELVRQRIQQKNLVEYVHREVIKSITPELQDKLINISLDKILLEFGKDDEKK